MSTEAAEYLDTQTLDGGEGYFHTGNGAAPEQSPETPLVAASRGEEPPTSKPGRAYEEMTVAELRERAADRGIPTGGLKKAELVAALRGE